MARDNVRLNRATAFVHVVRANGLADRRMQAGGPYDLVFANILLGPVRQLATPVRRVAAPGARVVVSGLLSGQGTAALAAYRARGFVLERRIVLDGWVTLVLARPGRQAGSQGHAAELLRHDSGARAKHANPGSISCARRHR